MTEYNEWKIWNGGECPVKPGTMGQVQLSSEPRDRMEFDRPSDIEGFNWAYGNPSSDIIAYRTVKDPVVEVVSAVISKDKLNCWVVKMEPAWINIILTDGKVTAVELAE